MKKISVLLFSLLLLFPVLIYVGNLADLSFSKTVIVYLRDLVGMSASKETIQPVKKQIEKIIPSHAHIGLINAWRNLAMTGFDDVLQVAATPETLQAWQSNTANFLNEALFATAFFSSSWNFWQVQQDKLSLVAYYQPWVDVLLLLEITEVNANYKITTIGLTEAKALTSTSPVATAQELSKRLNKAEQVFQSVAKNPTLLHKMLTSELAKTSQDNLQQYVNDIRNKLNSESAKNTRLAILDWLDAVQTGQLKDIQDLPKTERDWLTQLQIVQLTKLDAENWLLSVTNPNQAERVLIAQLQITDRKAQTKELQIWDAATIGRTQ